MNPIILVTQPEYKKAEQIFTSVRSFDCRPAPVDEKELALEISRTGCRIVILGTTPYTNELYTALAENAGGEGTLIIRFGFGMDSVSKEACEKHNITLANTPVDIQTSVAELTLFLIGSLMRRITCLDAGTRKGEFRSERGRELKGKTALIMGGGKIGLAVARMLHCGFQVETLIFDSIEEHFWRECTGISDREMCHVYGIKAYSRDLDILLPQADIASIHLPLSQETRGLLETRRMSMMKADALLINTSRGGIVDESALYDHLSTGKLAGAALDVFETEPYRPVDPARDLRKLPCVIMTPHCASDTTEANNRMAERSIEIATAFIEQS